MKKSDRRRRFLIVSDAGLTHECEVSDLELVFMDHLKRIGMIREIYEMKYCDKDDMLGRKK
jgi:hypothetical protein